MKRYAAIDIGSNAVRLLIADIITVNKVTNFKKNTLIRVPLRLGDDAFVKREISELKRDDLVKTMTAFKLLMDVYHVSDYMACATSALREATNGPEIVAKIKQVANLDLEIVAGQKEAKIIYASHVEESLDKSKTYLYIDVGGGSTELSIFSNNALVASKSFNIGTIRILDNQDKKESWEDMQSWIKQHVNKFKDCVGIGTGGNINKLFKLSDEKDDQPLSLTTLNDLYNYLNSFSLQERITVLKLNEDRADVIIPACQIYLSVMRWGDIQEIFVPRVGMVDGIIQLLIEKNHNNQ